MKLYLDGHAERYALEQLQMCLFPQEPMEFQEAPFSGDGAVSILRRDGDLLTARTVITREGRTRTAETAMDAGDETVPLRRRILQQSYYQAALPFLDAPPPWGALAGVRPTKLTTRVLLDGGTEEDCEAMLRNVYYVQPERRRLCIDASRATVEAAAKLEPHDISLYIGIPFCPTRCAYCSFVSQSIEKQAGLLEPFLEALLREIEETGRMVTGSRYRIRTVYMGGGTPTTLSASQMERLMDAISSHFDLTNLLEYTVEGGRPDTLDREKLAVIRRCGADRMSINPQTMQDDVLRRMGRRHTTAQTLEAYADAKAAGFEGINMDLIAGLPGDSPEGFANVGWCKPGWAGLYNIYMMEELQSILSLGGGGMSKINLPGGKLERLHNPKYPREYLDRLEDTLESHRAFFRILDETE